MSGTTEQVIAIVSEKLGVDKEKVKAETSFVSDLGADSLDMVELLMNLEDSFSTSIPDEDAEGIKTVGDAVKYIEEHQQGPLLDEIATVLKTMMTKTVIPSFFSVFEFPMCIPNR